MNQHNAKQFLPLVQALAEGKTVQLKSGSAWIDLTEVEWMADPERYRVKPEPLYRWVVATATAEFVFSDREGAEDFMRVVGKGKLHSFVEVQ